MCFLIREGTWHSIGTKRRLLKKQMGESESGIKWDSTGYCMKMERIGLNLWGCCCCLGKRLWWPGQDTINRNDRCDWMGVARKRWREGKMKGGQQGNNFYLDDFHVFGLTTWWAVHFNLTHLAFREQLSSCLEKKSAEPNSCFFSSCQPWMKSSIN